MIIFTLLLILFNFNDVYAAKGHLVLSCRFTAIKLTDDRSSLEEEYIFNLAYQNTDMILKLKEQEYSCFSH